MEQDFDYGAAAKNLEIENLKSAITSQTKEYQKALEAHHRKESEDAAIGGGLGESSRVPVDPPPQYTPSGGA